MPSWGISQLGGRFGGLFFNPHPAPRASLARGGHRDFQWLAQSFSARTITLLAILKISRRYSACRNQAPWLKVFAFAMEGNAMWGTLLFIVTAATSVSSFALWVAATSVF
jgi:hypothetical protein